MAYKIPEQLSLNFALREFTEVSSHRIPTFEPLFVYLLPWLQHIRTLFNVPVKITSFYRDEEKNERAGGAPNSAHLRAMAVDFYCPSLEPKREDQEDIFNFASGFHSDTRIIWYPTAPGRPHFYHIDCARIFLPGVYPAMRVIKNQET